MTNSALQAHSGEQVVDDLRKNFLEKLNTDHRIMTAELSRLWSLPEPMVEAYRFRAYPDVPPADRLGIILSAAALAVGNLEIEEERRRPLDEWAAKLNIDVDSLQKMATFGDRQRERIQSLAGNMTG